MDDQPKLFNTSRRQVLAGLSAVGLASAGAGLGTTAYFSDTESFAGNSLQAGEFDLKVDWKQLYFGAENDPAYGSAGRPHVNAFPDSDDDGVQDEILTRGELAETLGDDITSQAVEDEYRAQFADLPNDLEDPVIDLADVKPGDSGCLSMSMHLFDNPGYIWLGAENVLSAENGQSEPEVEAEGVDVDGIGELADAINATLWYDDDNDCEIDGDGSAPADVALVMDSSGSMGSEGKMANAKAGAKTLVDALGSDAQIALVDFDDDAVRTVDLTTDRATVKAGINDLVADGTTAMADGVQAGREELTGRDDLHAPQSPSGNHRANARKIMVFLTNGNPFPDGQDPTQEAAAAKADDDIEIFTIAYGSDANATLLSDMASSPESTHAFSATDIAAVEQVFALIGELIAGEEVIFSGTLTEVLAELQAGIELDGNRVEEGRQCFVNSTTQYVALHWDLPAEVGNEIQTDTLSFDVVFEAEQCRHNDAPANPFNATA